jgi:hypothetical protein
MCPPCLRAHTQVRPYGGRDQGGGIFLKGFPRPSPKNIASHHQPRNPVPVEQVEGDEAGQEEPGHSQGQPIPGRHVYR